MVPRYWDLSQGASPSKTRVPSLAVMVHQQLTASVLAVALLSLGASAIALFRKPGEAQRGFWLMIGQWGLLDGVIVWPSLLGDPMAADGALGAPPSKPPRAASPPPTATAAR